MVKVVGVGHCGAPDGRTVVGDALANFDGFHKVGWFKLGSEWFSVVPTSLVLEEVVQTPWPVKPGGVNSPAVPPDLV